MKKRNLQISKLNFDKITIMEFNQMKSIYGGTMTNDTNTGGNGQQGSSLRCSSIVIPYLPTTGMPNPEPIQGPQPQP